MKEKSFEDMSEEERLKYEVAMELGLLDRVKEEGWKALSASETGRIGGMVTKRKHDKMSGEGSH